MEALRGKTATNTTDNTRLAKGSRVAIFEEKLFSSVQLTILPPLYYNQFSHKD